MVAVDVDFDVAVPRYVAMNVDFNVRMPRFINVVVRRFIL